MVFSRLTDHLNLPPQVAGPTLLLPAVLPKIDGSASVTVRSICGRVALVGLSRLVGSSLRHRESPRMMCRLSCGSIRGLEVRLNAGSGAGPCKSRHRMFRLHPFERLPLARRGTPRYVAEITTTGPQRGTCCSTNIDLLCAAIKLYPM